MPKIICLVGPSGCGKTAISEELIKGGNFTKVKTATSRLPRENETNDSYIFMGDGEFKGGIGNGMFLEYSTYAGCHYGTPKCSVDGILEKGNNAIVPIDINGARAYKRYYGDQVLVVFVYRDKKTIIDAICERNIPSSEKAKRILQLDGEYSLIQECDYCVINNGTIKNAAIFIKNLC